MSIEYNNFLYSNALQNSPKFGLLVWKHTIWQPCSIAASATFRKNQSENCTATSIDIIFNFLSLNLEPILRLLKLQLQRQSFYIGKK
jgi:hypothetical protein